MQENRDAFCKLADRASFLWERLTGGYVPATATDTNEVDRRLARWRQTVAKGNAEVFVRRLTWDGWTESQAREFLGPVTATTEPAWIAVLRTLVNSIREARTPTPIREGTPLPFVDVLWPIVRFARASLDSRLKDRIPFDWVSPQVWDDLEASFAERLATLLTTTLYDEFDRFRKDEMPLLGWLRERGSRPSPTDHYRAFVVGLLADGLLGLFDRYPVLARLTVTTITQWAVGTAQFLERLTADRTELAVALGHQDSTCCVERIRAGVSDPHNGGLGVILVKFASGEKAVYKPKDLATDVGFRRLVEWVNNAAVMPPLRTPRVLARTGYGWLEFIPDAPCPDRAAAERYFQRAGGLLALAYVLGTNDLHYENIIAAGEFPVLIDTETILHHRSRFLVENDHTEDYSRSLVYALGDSVLRPGLLPQWFADPTGRNAIDLSALGFVGEGQLYGERLHWDAVNTDDMRPRTEPGKMEPSFNAPVLDGRQLAPDGFAQELIDGFTRLYRLLSERREEFVAPGGPLSAFEGVAIRFIFRDTRHYLAMLERLTRPAVLQNGADWSIEAEAFARPHLVGIPQPISWPVFFGEVTALSRGDVSCFTALADSDALTGGVEQPIKGYFLSSAIEGVKRRLAELSDANLQLQIDLIQGSLHTFVARNSSPFVGPTADGPSDTALSPEELRAEAARLARELEKAAIRGSDNEWNWLGLAYMPTLDRYQLTVLGDGLYYGRAGIALFLAAAGLGDLALDALAPSRAAVRELVSRSPQEVLRLGNGNGIGSAIYTFTRVGRLLGNNTLLDDARLAASLVTDASIAADRNYDVLDGTAGALLALLAFHRETGDRDVLALATQCGTYLFDSATRMDGERLSWPTIDARPQTGFAHGAAGIAYALARLAAVTGDNRYLAGAAGGIAFEGSLFDPAVGEWPDQRATRSGHFTASWCYGGPGIALARVGGLTALDSPAIRADIAAGVVSIRRAGPRDLDHICCGRLGRAEALAVMGEQLGEADWIAEANGTTTALVQAARSAGGYRLYNNLPATVSHPGFFQGIAGIGYHLLRTADPTRLPSALLFG